MDMAGSLAKLQNPEDTSNLDKLEKEIEELRTQKRKAIDEDDFVKAQEIRDKEIETEKKLEEEKKSTGKKFKVGIIGTGWIAEAHVKAYQKCPDVEIVALAGIGFGHNYSSYQSSNSYCRNALNSKFGLDFAFNLGSEKQWQLYFEPSITYGISNLVEKQADQYNINKSNLQLNVGVNYYFKTSNGTHHFMNITECDQREIDALNNTINSLRDKNAADQAKIAQLQAEIARLQKALRDCENKPAPEAPFEAPVIPNVFYNVNKSLITKQQAENVAVAAQVLKNHPELKLNVKGYATPEGPSKRNQTLSVRRANAVKDLLVKKYGIDESRITTEGCGTTKDMYETYENNRVAMMFFEK